MTTRTTSKSIIFRQPFSLPGVDGLQPPGSYVVETDEEEISGISFQAFRRLATTIELQVPFRGTLARQVVAIDPEDLAAAQARDAEFGAT